MYTGEGPFVSTPDPTPSTHHPRWPESCALDTSDRRWFDPLTGRRSPADPRRLALRRKGATRCETIGCEPSLPRRTDRRTILKGAGATLTLAAATPFFRTGAGAATLRQTPTTTDISGTSLSILLWSHFVPLHDVWFDQFVAEWGEANGVTTQVDHINTADVPAAIAAEIAAGEGHDIVEHIASLAQYEKSVLDMTDVVEELNNRHGEQLPMAMRNSLQPDHQCLLRSLPRLRARPGQLPQLALGAGRAGRRPVDLGRAAGAAAPRSRRSRASRWASGCRTRSTPAWPPRR